MLAIWVTALIGTAWIHFGRQPALQPPRCDQYGDDIDYDAAGKHDAEHAARVPVTRGKLVALPVGA
jgi:hypothetical protein